MKTLEGLCEEFAHEHDYADWFTMCAMLGGIPMAALVWTAKAYASQALQGAASRAKVKVDDDAMKQIKRITGGTAMVTLYTVDKQSILQIIEELK